MPHVLSTLLQGAPPQPSILEQLAPFALVFGIFYVLVIAPSQKKQATQEALLKNLKPGDNVILASGIFGTVESADGDTVFVRIAEKTRIRVQRSAISGLESTEKQAEKK